MVRRAAGGAASFPSGSTYTTSTTEQSRGAPPSCTLRRAHSPAVAAAGADHVLVVTGEANVGDVSRVAKVALVFGLEESAAGEGAGPPRGRGYQLTYKLVGAGEVKELEEAEVVSGHQVEASV